MALDLNNLQDISAESGVICSIINNPQFYNLSDFLQPQHFSQKELGAVYYVCGQLLQSGVYELDAFNITVQANSHKGIKKLIDEYGGDKFIKDLVDTSGIIARNTTEEYLLSARNVSELGFRRELYKKLKGFENDTFDISNPLSALNSKIITELDLLAEKYVSNNNSPLFKEKVDSLLSIIEEKQARSKNGLYGLPWSVDIFNRTVGGMTDGELYLIAGRRKSMKSVILLNEAIHKAQSGLSVLMTSTEMTDEKDFLRGLAIISGIPIDDIKKGNIGDHNYQKYRDAIHFFKNANFHREYDSNWTADKLIMKAKEIKHKMGLDFMAHDYIKITHIHGSAEQSNALGEQANMLKNVLAGDFGIPVLSAVQVGRNNEIADSDKLERYATLALKISKKSREEVAEDGVECGNMKVHVPFARDGHYLEDDEDYMDIYADMSPLANLRVYEAKSQHTAVTPDFIKD